MLVSACLLPMSTEPRKHIHPPFGAKQLVIYLSRARDVMRDERQECSFSPQ